MKDENAGLLELFVRKPRGDCKVGWLTVAQRVEMCRWLFEEARSYQWVCDRAKAEFGFKGSRESVKRFGQKVLRDRMLKEMEQEQGRGLDRVRNTVLGQLAANLEAEEYGGLSLGRVLGLLLTSEANELKRERNKLEEAVKKFRFEQGYERAKSFTPKANQSKAGEVAKGQERASEYPFGNRIKGKLSGTGTDNIGQKPRNVALGRDFLKGQAKRQATANPTTGKG